MRTWARRGSAAVFAALVLAAVVSTASANRLSTSSQQIRATWSQVSFEFGVGTIRCKVTLEGSFHARTFTKVRETLLGYITRAVIQTPCEFGELHFLAETLPWHLHYESFTGTLPRMTSVRFKIAEMSLWFTREFGIRCLYRSSFAFAWLRGEPPLIPASASMEGSLPETQGGICLGTIRFEGRGGRLTNEGGSTEVTLTLI